MPELETSIKRWCWEQADVGNRKVNPNPRYSTSISTNETFSVEQQIDAS
jgi:hypothetical protein